MKKGLQEVFTINGIPHYTFVEPKEYTDLVVALKTPGRGIVIEGPSGIGKTTAIVKAVQKTLNIDEVLILTPRKREDIDYIKGLTSTKPFGTIVIDDFHRLDDKTKSEIADLMKVLADAGESHSKLIVLGINKAGENLISFGSDLNTRIEIITFGTNSQDKIQELLEKGQKELNICLNINSELVVAANGSFYLAQMLAYYSCIESKITEEQDVLKSVNISFELVNGKVLDILKRRFKNRTLSFVRGTKLRQEGRAPYLQLLYNLSIGQDGILDIKQLLIEKNNLKGSIGQVVSKGYLEKVLEDNVEYSEVLYYLKESNLLIVQDPQYIYYLKNITWASFSKEAGYLTMEFTSRYDFALSFAGSDRGIANQIFETLQSEEFEVFYDYNEQYRLLAEDIEDYLRPIYSSEAAFVIVIIGPDYPKRLWTQFESSSFKHRFSDGSVIPVVLSTVELSAFDITNKIGYYSLDLNKNLTEQITNLVSLLSKKIAQKRHND